MLSQENIEYPQEDLENEDRGLKVFHVLAGGPWGGGAVVVLALTRALIHAGCQVWVLCLDDLVAQRFAEAGAQVVRCDTWRREISPLYDLISFWKLFHLCRRERFDLVVTHTSKGGVLGRMAARLAGAPRVIHTAHGFPFTEAGSRWSALLYTYLERWAGHFCDLVISVNEEERLTAIRRKVIRPDKIVTVLNGIDLVPFEDVGTIEATRRGLGVPDDALIVGTVGRLAEQKGFTYLIQAIPQVLRACPQAWFVFAGSGPLESELRALAAEKGVAGHCRFLGFREDIPALLGCCDLFILPSLWEGLSITLLEAMAAAKPVVATDIKGNREVIEDGVDGLLVAPADPEALANAIIELLKDRERAQAMGARAHRKIRQHFSQAAMVENTLRWYGLNEELCYRNGLFVDRGTTCVQKRGDQICPKGIERGSD
jgi:glycosyltransferase involved in cell wall biosynthesis